VNVSVGHQQRPDAVQAWFAGHEPFDPAGRLAHAAPPEQAWHGPVQASAQQMPSDEHMPLAQPTPPSAQSSPFESAQTLFAEHVWPDGQSPSATQDL
jgi:hypothetical protein